MKIQMRNLIALLVLALSISTLVSAPATANGPGVCGPENFAGGTGTQGDPYQIQNENALSELRDCGASTYYHYILIADIAVTGSWQEIDTFTGSLNGNDHEISNLDISGNSQYTGFFRIVEDSEIFNLGISGTVSSIFWSTGLLAGIASDSTFYGITAEVEIDADAVTGGLVGEAYGSSFEDIAINPLTPASEISVSNGTVGGLVGLSENTSLEDIYSNINIHGTAVAGYIGGVAGIDRLGGPVEVKTQMNLNYTGDITSNYSGSGTCGGIIGAADQKIDYATVIGSTIGCEGTPIGGVVGFGTNSISHARVEANLEVNEVDNGQDGVVGGIVGYWIGVEDGEFNFEGNSFTGSIDSAVTSAGLISFMVLNGIDLSSQINISNSYVRATFQNGSGAGGIIGTVFTDVDLNNESDAELNVSNVYVDNDFENIYSMDPVFYFVGYPVNIDSVVWNNPGVLTTSYTESAIETNLATMKRPGFWKNYGFDIDTVWGLSSTVNDGLPVLRYQFDVDYDVACVVKAFPDLHFGYNKTTLTPKAKRILTNFATRVKNGNCYNIYVAAFASGKEILQGKKKAAHQQTLSNKRLRSALRYLDTKLATSDIVFEIFANALGSNYKKNKDKTKKQQAANRRVEIGTTS
jgi:outer membrane protein OmpA-like peptidoglycan-associated protein